MIVKIIFIELKNQGNNKERKINKNNLIECQSNKKDFFFSGEMYKIK